MRRSYEEDRGLDAEVVMAAGIQLCEALEHGAHACGPDGVRMALVHRDLSPLNVFVTEKGCVKLLDFGIARVAGASRHRSSSALRGKPSYRSPEMVRGEYVDARSDLFTLGIILWEALAGRKLFCSQPIEESERRILTMRIPKISRLRPSVPAGLDLIVARMLCRDPRMRFQEAAELGTALRSVYRMTTDRRQHHVLRDAVRHSGAQEP